MFNNLVDELIHSSVIWVPQIKGFYTYIYVCDVKNYELWLMITI